MRIVIDMQGAQTESRFRGIGRYTLRFAQAVARNRGEHDVLLVLSGLFPDTIEPIRVAFDALLPQENILVWHAPGPVKDIEEKNRACRQIAELLREAFLFSLNPDIIHISSLFEGYIDDAVTSIGQFDARPAVTVSLYDLIPLLNPDHYLTPNQTYAVHYQRKLQNLKRADRFLAISEYARKEGLQYLGVDEQRIINVSSAADPGFHLLSPSDNDTSAQLRKIGLHKPFVLYTGGTDERKNLARLVEAWSLLPASLRQTHQLLLAGRMPEDHATAIRRMAKMRHMIDDEIVICGYVSDEELVQLYNRCKLFIFPSWHEGFGLPALEAMACGAPVIASNTTSLPEVIGLEAALFDPFDAMAISDKIRLSLNDDNFLSMLREHGLKQSRNFSWDATAKRAIATWETLHFKHQATRRNSWQEAYKHHQFIHQQQIEQIAEIVATHGLPEGTLRLTANALARNDETSLAMLRTLPLPDKLTWRIEGPFDSSYSLALVNRELARALEKNGHTVVLHSTEGPGDFEPDPEFLAANPDLAQMHQRTQAISQWGADATSRNLYPPRVSDMHSRLNFLHAYGWEESGFPLDWVDAFNRSLQGMTVMSEHVRKVMIDHGVTVPITVSSLGVDHWLRVEPDNTLQLQAKTFRFLHVSSCFPRKGADTLLRAFSRAFRSDDDVTLIIKTFSNPHNQIHQWLAEARGNDADFPDVQIIEADYTDAQMKSLYEQCHVLVAPSRAEGFGLPMAEAMLSNLAVITTGWSGQTDFCSEKTAWLIDYKFERAQSHFGLTASVWAEPDEAHLCELLIKLHSIGEVERQERVSEGRRLLLESFRWEQAASRIVEAARRLAKPMPNTEPRIGWVTTWNTKCGIANYSKHLIDQIPAPVSVLAAQANELIEVDSPNVRRCWINGGHGPLDELAYAVEALQLDTIVIQFNYGFFDFGALGDFIEKQTRAGRSIIVVLHATRDPVHAPDKSLSRLVSAFRRCDRLLVHSPDDMNRLKNLGLVDNVSLFPHGILASPIPESALRQTDGELIIASYGFFLPHKGLIELIEAIEQLRDTGMAIRLDMVNAEYPNDESQKCINQAKTYIRKRRLKDTVSLSTDYLSDSDCLKRLSKADLIVFAYQETGESSSAAVRHGIASGRPVAVTPLTIFNDIMPAVYSLPGTTPFEIAKGIRSILTSIKNNDDIAKSKADQARKWRNEHQHAYLGLRLHQLIQAIWKRRLIA